MKKQEKVFITQLIHFTFLKLFAESIYLKWPKSSLPRLTSTQLFMPAAAA